MVYRPVFRIILVEPVKEETTKNKVGKVLIPEEEGAQLSQEKYTKCKVIEFSRDCMLIKGIVLNPEEERFVVVQSHMIEQIVIDGKVSYIVPETAVVLMSSSK